MSGGSWLYWFVRHRVLSKDRWRTRAWVLGVLSVVLLGVYGYDELLMLRRQVMPAATPSGAGIAGDVTSFYELFPEKESLVMVLGRIHDAAPRHRLALPQGDLRLEEVMQTKQLMVQTATHSLYRYSVNFAVRGEWRAVGEYVVDVTSHDHGVGLASMTFSRDGGQSGENEYLLVFEVYALD